MSYGGALNLVDIWLRDRAMRLSIHATLFTGKISNSHNNLAAVENAYTVGILLLARQTNKQNRQIDNTDRAGSVLQDRLDKLEKLLVTRQIGKKSFSQQDEK